jgi:hypothetical protein
MKKSFFCLLLLLNSLNYYLNAQENVVKIIASGSGSNEKEAINEALRSCIEKSFGVFISTSTEIDNDKLVKDKITTIAQGTIKSYTIISSIDNGKKVVISAEVTPSKIVDIVKSKGYDVSLNGSIYAQNAIKEEYYKKQELIVIDDFFSKYEEISFFDYSIIVSDPKNYKRGTEQDFEIYYENKNYKYDKYTNDQLATYDKKIASEISKNYELVANQYGLKKKDFVQGANILGWESFFPNLGNRINVNSGWMKYVSASKVFKRLDELTVPSNTLKKKSENDNIQFVQVLIVPTLNKNYLDFVKSFYELLNSLNITDTKSSEQLIGKVASINISNLKPLINDLGDKKFNLRNQEVVPKIVNFFERVRYSSTILNFNSEVFNIANEVYVELPKAPSSQGEPVMYRQELNSREELSLFPFYRKDSKEFITFSPSRAILFFDINSLNKTNEFKLSPNNKLYYNEQFIGVRTR